MAAYLPLLFSWRQMPNWSVSWVGFFVKGFVWLVFCFWVFFLCGGRWQLSVIQFHKKHKMPVKFHPLRIKHTYCKTQMGFGFYLLCHGTCIFEVSQMKMEIVKLYVLTAKLIKIPGVKFSKYLKYVGAVKLAHLWCSWTQRGLFFHHHPSKRLHLQTSAGTQDRIGST